MIMKIKQLINENNPIICYIEGDGIGKEITESAKKIFDVAVEHVYNGEKKVIWKKLLAGEESLEKTGELLPQESLDAINQHYLAIKGPLMTPIGGGFRSINVTLRQQLDLYACIRPVEYFEGVDAPVKNPQNVNMTIFRENTEDIYAGIEFASETSEAKTVIDFLSNEMGIKKIRFPQTSAIGIKPVSPDGTKRLVRAAFEHAKVTNKNRVTLVHKGNIMKFTEGGFREWGYEIAKDYPNITTTDVIADNFLQQILIKPQDFDVVATLNLNGDYISDALAAQVGGIGISPGANINFDTGHAVFEATHGTAPDIVGKNMANPSSLILSGVMMFEYIGWSEVSEKIKTSLAKAIREGKTTKDLGGNLGTTQFVEEVIAKLKNRQ